MMRVATVDVGCWHCQIREMNAQAPSSDAAAELALYAGILIGGIASQPDAAIPLCVRHASRFAEAEPKLDACIGTWAPPKTSPRRGPRQDDRRRR